MASNDKVTKLPFQPERLPVAFEIDGRAVDSVLIKTMSFGAFVDMLTEATNMPQPKSFEARLRRLRMVKQVQYFNGAAGVQITAEDVLRMPIPAARLIGSKLDTDDAPAGKIVRPGDGIDKAIVYELGTPIPTGQGKQPIRELEFAAKTYGDIEDVLVSDSMVTQAAKLIETVAKPLGTSLSLLPSWALTQITIADGMIIGREVLPHFLGSADES